jgi:hypothetical protein
MEIVTQVECRVITLAPLESALRAEREGHAERPIKGQDDSCGSAASIPVAGSLLISVPQMRSCTVIATGTDSVSTLTGTVPVSDRILATLPSCGADLRRNCTGAKLLPRPIWR